MLIILIIIIIVIVSMWAPYIYYYYMTRHEASRDMPANGTLKRNKPTSDIFKLNVSHKTRDKISRLILRTIREKYPNLEVYRTLDGSIRVSNILTIDVDNNRNHTHNMSNISGKYLNFVSRSIPRNNTSIISHIHNILKKYIKNDTNI